MQARAVATINMIVCGMRCIYRIEFRSNHFDESNDDDDHNDIAQTKL